MFHTEQDFLRLSIIVTGGMALFGVVCGILAHSSSIIFDSMYALGDASMGVLALMVANLINAYTQKTAENARLRERFSVGLWHLEPIVLGLNGTMLIGVSVYALVNAILALFTGGRMVQFDFAILYGVITLAACAAMAVLGHRANKVLRSEFVGLDATAWIMSGGITAALLAAFVIGAALQGTAWESFMPYVDPVILALICLVIIPLPVATVRQALSEILLLTPEEAKRNADEVAAATVMKYNFLSFRTYVAKVGRSLQTEIYFIVKPGMPARRVEEWDEIRNEISAVLGGQDPHQWLTIAFTTDRAWAE